MPFLPPLPDDLAKKASDEKAKSDAKGNSAGDNVVCSLEVADWSMSSVLDVLSKQTGVNVICMSSPEKKLTVRLKDVKLSEMIRHICAISGMSYLKTGTTYVIATVDQLKAAYPVEWSINNPTLLDPMQEISADIYMCSYVNATQVADTLRSSSAIRRNSWFWPVPSSRCPLLPASTPAPARVRPRP